MRATVLILIAAILSCARPVQEPRSPSAGAAHFTLATFNVHRATYGDAETVALIGKLGADVIALQEITAGWQRAIEREYAAAYPYRLYAPRYGAGGLGVLSRFPLVDRGLLPAVKKHPAWLVEIHGPGGPVQLLNVHLRAWSMRGKNLIAAYLAVPEDHRAEIASFLSACGALPTLVAGDFNESPNGSAVEWLEARSFVNALPRFRPGQATWRLRSLAGQLTRSIDHILFDSSFAALDAWVVKGGSSDHLPVVAHVELRPERVAIKTAGPEPRPRAGADSPKSAPAN